MSFVVSTFHCRFLKPAFLRRGICHMICVNGIPRFGNRRMLFKFISVSDINNCFLSDKFNDSSIDDYNLQSNFIKEIKHSEKFNGELSIFKSSKFSSEISAAVQCKDFRKIVTAVFYCDKHNISPEFKVLVLLIDVLSFHGVEDGVQMIKNLSKRLYSNEYNENCEFDHFVAQIKWCNGNFNDAIQKLFYIYENYPSLNDIVFKLVQRILHVTVFSKGVAVKTNIFRTILKYTKRTGDYSLMAAYWFAIFQSEWYDDQREAVDILKNETGLQNYISPLISTFALKLLKHDQVNEVYILMESLLKCQMQSSFRAVILALFDYYYINGDSKRCTAVWDCCKIMNLKIPQDQAHKYEQLMSINSKDSAPLKNSVKPAYLLYKF